MKIKPIRNEKEYQKALERLEDIFDAKKGTEEGEELEILSTLIERYEDEKFKKIEICKCNRSEEDGLDVNGECPHCGLKDTN